MHSVCTLMHSLIGERQRQTDWEGGKWASTWLVSGKGESQTLIVILRIPHPKPQDHNTTLINKYRGKCKSQICNFALCICCVGKLKGNGKQQIRNSKWWRWSEIATSYYIVQGKLTWREKKKLPERKCRTSSVNSETYRVRNSVLVQALRPEVCLSTEGLVSFIVHVLLVCLHMDANVVCACVCTCVHMRAYMYVCMYVVHTWCLGSPLTLLLSRVLTEPEAHWLKDCLADEHKNPPVPTCFPPLGLAWSWRLLRPPFLHRC